MSADVRLTIDSLVVRSPDQLSGDIDHEVVLLSLNQGAYYQLNDVGSRIWELLESPTTVDALIEQLVKEFDVTREACQAQVFDFLRALLVERLIVVASADER
jgi:hypothetical protein